MAGFLVSPRALLLHAGMLAAVIAMVWLAQWQWERAQTRVVDPGSLAAVPFAELSTPGDPEVRPEAVGRAVEVSGRYVEGQRYVVVGQPVDGRAASFDLAVLRLADGSQVPIVRGTVENPTEPSAAPLPTGRVVVVGRIQPSDDLIAGSDRARSDPEQGVLSGIATSELVAVVGRPLHPGWVASGTETLADGTEAAGPPAVPDSALLIPDGGLRVQNVLYAIQWAVFAGFVVLVYRRFILDAWHDHQRARLVVSADVEETV